MWWEIICPDCGKAYFHEESHTCERPVRRKTIWQRIRRAILTLPDPVCCHDCGLPYSDAGFADLVLPNEMWARVSPTGDEGGSLCPTCLVRAASKAGVKCKATFRSGPFDWNGAP